MKIKNFVKVANVRSIRGIKWMSALIVISVMSGCGTTGNKALKSETESSIASKVVVGKTTRKEIQQMFGAPLSSAFDGGLLVWNYEFDDTSIDAITIPSIIFTMGLAGTRSSGTRKQLTLLFSDHDIVKKFNMSESPITTGTMLMK